MLTPLELSGAIASGALLLVAALGLVMLARQRRQARERTDALGAALAASEAVTVALSEEALFLSAVLACVDEGVVMVDGGWRARFVNERFEELFGLRGADLIGRDDPNLLRTLGPLFADEQAFLRAAEGGWPEGTELVIERPARRVLQIRRRPVRQGHMTVGTLEVFRDVTAQRDAEADREKLMAELSARATTDVLTGLGNRRAATEALAAEATRARRYERRCSIALFDIDHFKRINDDFGHDIGDQVLKVFADVLRRTARSTDVVARWGGEEFLAIVLEADASAGCAFVERVRRALAEAQPLEVLREAGSNEHRRLTTSCGVAALVDEGDGIDAVESALRRADEALYRAKREGRDRVVMAETPITQRHAADARVR